MHAEGQKGNLGGARSGLYALRSDGTLAGAGDAEQTMCAGLNWYMQVRFDEHGEVIANSATTARTPGTNGVNYAIYRQHRQQ